MPHGRYAILGFPLSHTFSPAMQNAAFKELDISAEYLPIEILPKEFDSFVVSPAFKELDGFNLTIPFKERIIDSLDSFDEGDIPYIGAVNTVKKENNQLMGFNTDWIGFQAALLEEFSFDAENKKILLLGAGGSTRACLFALVKAGASEIVIANRTLSKAEALAKSDTCRAVSLDTLDWEEALENTDLVVNTTSCGLREGDPLLIPAHVFQKTKGLLYDLIYNPAETKLMQAAKSEGWKTANGLSMLLYQGTAAFEIWTGKKAPIDTMKEALNQQL